MIRSRQLYYVLSRDKQRQIIERTEGSRMLRHIFSERRRREDSR